MAPEQENQRLFGDLQEINIEKQQHEALTLRVQKLEAIIVSLPQEGT